MAVADGGFPFTQRDVVTEIYGDSSNRSLTELFSVATGTFDPAYVGSKNSLYNFRNYQHVIFSYKFGLLYNWYAVVDSRNIAPAGWHVPSSAEFASLASFIGGYQYGGKLKKIGTEFWNSPNTGATNEYGFNGIGSGVAAGTYSQYGIFTSILSSSGYYVYDEYYREGLYYGQNYGLYSNSPYISSTYETTKRNGHSVRLIKDDSVNNGSMLDNDGNVYQTVKIGSQVWMASNLKTTKYRNGDLIQKVTDSLTWCSIDTGSMCAYEFNDANI